MKKYLITGLILLIPVVLTLIIFVFLIDLLTNPFLDVTKDLLLLLHKEVPILQNENILMVIARIVSIILLIVFTLVLGFLGRAFFFKGMINWANNLLARIPFIKGIFTATKDIVSSFISTKEERKAFRNPILTAFPSDKGQCVGFVTGEIPKKCQEKVKQPLTAVFIPTAPHPISGYLVMVPNTELDKIDMTNEEAVKFTVSCGMITPETIKANENQISP